MAHAWKACWVQALGGSNPPSSATGPRDRFRFRGFCCVWRRWCSGRRRAWPPARSPHASLRLGVVDLEARPCPPDPPAPSSPAALVSLGLARPGPAAAHGHRSQALWSLRRPPHQCDFCFALALLPPVSIASGFLAHASTKMLVVVRCTPDWEDSTPSDRVESCRSG